jgi:hypothetical protein
MFNWRASSRNQSPKSEYNRKDLSMNEKKKPLAQEVLESVKGGLSDDQLMSKFQLSRSELQGELQKLVDEGLLTQAELTARASLFGETVRVPPPAGEGKKGATQSGDHDKVYCPRCRREVASAPGQQFCGSCGGKLVKHPEVPKYCPWEDAGNLGWPQAFIQTINNCLFSTKSFFSGLPSNGGYRKPLIFGIILASIGMIFYQAWSVVFGMGQLGYHGRVIAIALIVFAPVFAVIVVPLSSLLLHACVLLVSEGSHKGFEATFRVCCYSTSAQLCNFVPILGYPAAAIWATYLVIMGVREVHGVTTGKAALAVFLPWIVILVLLALFLFVAFKAGL